jgi:uncharacterized peroxidase-related enzyme
MFTASKTPDAARADAATALTQEIDMTDYAIHTVDSAPEGSKPLLEKAQAKFGFVPTILGAMAEAPATLEGYMTLAGIFDKASLTPAERQLVQLIISRENECHFCVAAHSGGAMKAGADKAVVDAAREGDAIADAKLSALRDFAVAVTVARGHVSEAQLEAFLDAGYTKQQAFEVILAVSLKVMTNYVDAIADVPLNEQLKPLAWVPPSKRAAE